MSTVTPIIMESSDVIVGTKLAELREKKINKVHIDIVDGLFADLLTIAPADLQQFDLSSFQLDLHLLVDDPMEWVEECVALKPKRLIAQIEKMGSQQLYLETVGGYGVAGGLALKVETPIEEIEEEVLKACPVILLLSIAPGTSGNPFDERVIPKIRELRERYNGSILIDGGINPVTYKQVLEAGASEAGANNAWWSGKFEIINSKLETN